MSNPTHLMCPINLVTILERTCFKSQTPCRWSVWHQQICLQNTHNHQHYHVYERWQQNAAHADVILQHHTADSSWYCFLTEFMILPFIAGFTETNDLRNTEPHYPQYEPWAEEKCKFLLRKERLFSFTKRLHKGTKRQGEKTVLGWLVR